MKPNEFLAQIGNMIRRRRELEGMTQADLAERSGICRTSIANIEAGRQDTTLTRFLDIAWGLKTTPENLIPGVVLSLRKRKRRKVA